jgi:hypothetical protein
MNKRMPRHRRSLGDPRTGLSRRRSRVRVPSLPLNNLPANRPVVLSQWTPTGISYGPIVAQRPNGKALQIGISAPHLCPAARTRVGHSSPRASLKRRRKAAIANSWRNPFGIGFFEGQERMWTAAWSLRVRALRSKVLLGNTELVALTVQLVSVESPASSSSLRPRLSPSGDSVEGNPSWGFCSRPHSREEHYA